MKQKNQRQIPTETCSFCGKKTVRLYAKNHTFGQGPRMIVIENVPTYVCHNCRKSYLTAETSPAIDEILAHPDPHTSPSKVNVATLAA